MRVRRGPAHGGVLKVTVIFIESPKKIVYFLCIWWLVRKNKMGNVLAASHTTASGVPSPPITLAPPPPLGTQATQPSRGFPRDEPILAPVVNCNPGTFEELHKQCKGKEAVLRPAIQLVLWSTFSDRPFGVCGNHEQIARRPLHSRCMVVMIIKFNDDVFHHWQDHSNIFHADSSKALEKIFLYIFVDFT
jgi:hypothetical protein